MLYPLPRQHRGLATPDHMLGPAHRGGGIDGDNVAGHQPVKQHADGGQVLLHRRLLKILAEGLDVGRDVQRLDVGEPIELVTVAPGEEPADGMQIGPPGCSGCGWWGRRTRGSDGWRARRRRR